MGGFLDLIRDPAFATHTQYVGGIDIQLLSKDRMEFLLEALGAGELDLI